MRLQFQLKKSSALPIDFLVDDFGTHFHEVFVLGPDYLVRQYGKRARTDGRRSMAALLALLSLNCLMLVAITKEKDTTCVYDEARSKQNTTAILYLGQHGSVDACISAVASVPAVTAYSWFDPTFNHADAKWAAGCYGRTDGKYPKAKKVLVTSGVVSAPPSPTPPSPTPGPPGGKCSVDLDCSLNGVCTTGSCACDAAWKGDHCETLALLPGARRSGYREINDPTWGNTSSWGGGGYYDVNESTWFMWATELSEHCGMHTWTTNSQTIRASSSTGTGLYTREAVQIPIWSHESVVTRGPRGEYIAFFSYNADEGPGRAVCHKCTDGSTAAACKKAAANLEVKVPPSPGPLGIENTDPTFMSWSSTARGNWSKPVMVLGPKVEMDTNMAAVVLANNSLIGMWRDHYGAKKPGHSTPHLVTANDWRVPESYVYAHTDLIKAGGKGIEDMFLWVDARGHFHSVFHCMDAGNCCETCTGHACSEDGLLWKWTGLAATGTATYDDGTSEVFGHCERPHLLFDKDGFTPIALTNGVKIQGLSNDDQSFTLLRPLQR
jgi:hypothetical protein